MANREVSTKGFEDIRPGDRIVLLVFAGLGRQGPTYRPKRGRVVMRGPAGWVVNTGREACPVICDEGNFVEVL